ncbi:uncharacterized protein [Nicotiana tomentosiformis]|uniref:uncharacterized protein n=1 Tax=Nicotiana tomentosiformis TaxID=4098 RepID=UPI00051B6CEC|nr:uncharacterized protein LOC104103094 [Nicotiana tomentosiformis]
MAIIKKGDYPISAPKSDKKMDGQTSTNPVGIDVYSNEEMAMIQVNVKARNLLYNTINEEEYDKILNCDIVKEMWDKLEVTYEGTSKVKKIRIHLFIHDYELFQIKKDESIEEMFARFNKIIGDLKAFGKPYSSGKHV